MRTILALVLVWNALKSASKSAVVLHDPEGLVLPMQKPREPAAETASGVARIIGKSRVRYCILVLWYRKFGGEKARHG